LLLQAFGAFRALDVLKLNAVSIYLAYNDPELLKFWCQSVFSGSFVLTQPSEQNKLQREFCPNLLECESWIALQECWKVYTCRWVALVDKFVSESCAVSPSSCYLPSAFHAQGITRCHWKSKLPLSILAPFCHLRCIIFVGIVVKKKGASQSL